MRNENYEKASKSFSRIAGMLTQGGYSGAELSMLLDEFVKTLTLASLYANESIRGLKRRKLKRYKYDKEKGVLEEELVLSYFLEELISSTEFLKKRLNTDSNIRVYRERIKRFQAQKPGEQGFLNNILQTVDIMSETNPLEVEKFIGLLEERYKMGDKLLAIIKDKHDF